MREGRGKKGREKKGGTGTEDVCEKNRRLNKQQLRC